MKNKLIFIPLILILAILLSSNISLAETGGGGYPGAFFQTFWGARAMALGGTYVAIADDAEGNLFNPAGSAMVKEKLAAGSYRQMSLDRRVGYLAYTQMIKNEAGIGLSWVNVVVSDVEQRDVNGQPNGSLSNYQNLFALTFSRRVSPEFAVGVNVKYLQTNLGNIQSSGVGFDLGALYLPRSFLRVGLVVENFGLKHNWSSGDFWDAYGFSGSSHTEEFPVSAKLGAAALFLKNQLLVALDLEKRENQDVLLHIGGEYWYRNVIAARAGLNRGDVTLGLGLKHKLRKVTVFVNYAFITESVAAGADNLISLQVGF
ncbi:MAG TPA: PorV/PorQ family protein [candidate division Zixibacteria bacterium]|nr:PorV/PorQ family protein [candidate division Zixibacteria bacterium]